MIIDKFIFEWGGNIFRYTEIIHISLKWQKGTVVEEQLEDLDFNPQLSIYTCVTLEKLPNIVFSSLKR